MSGLSNTLIDSLREYLLDQEELNQLNLNKKELEDPVLKRAVEDGIVAYDLIPPFSSTDSTKLTTGSKEWFFIKRLAAVEAFDGLIFLNIRNSNPVNDNGFQVDEFSKARDWQAIKESMSDRVSFQVKRYKRMLQLQSFSPSSVSFQNG